MKSKIFSLAVASLFAFTALNAQEKAGHKEVFAKDGFGSHWFIELGNAATVNFGGDNGQADFADRIAYVNPTLGIGKWFSPYFASRVQVMAGEMIDYTRSCPLPCKIAKGTHQYATGQLDFMFDVTNFFAPYKANRVFHFIPFVGVGTTYVHKCEYKDLKDKHDAETFSPTAHLGLQLKFHIAKRFDFNLEAQAIAQDLRFKSYATNWTAPQEPVAFRGSVTGMLGASLGINLGKVEFTPVVPQDEELLKSLNDKLNMLRAENAELSKRPKFCPELAPAEVVKSISIGNVVYFRLNSARVDANQMVNIHQLAQYAKNNTEVIYLVGYADRQTGTPEYNYELSQRRAEAVKAILVKKYGIEEDRIKTSWEGDRVQPYDLNEWNRVVIMNAR